MESKLIHSDARGSISSLTGPELTMCPEVTIFHTKKGFARGGCLHKHSIEYLVVIEGIIVYTYLDHNGMMQNKMLCKGDNFILPPDTPHYFVANTDCIVAEWGPTLEEKVGKHEGFRNIVNEINRVCTTNQSSLI